MQPTTTIPASPGHDVEREALIGALIGRAASIAHGAPDALTRVLLMQDGAAQLLALALAGAPPAVRPALLDALHAVSGVRVAADQAVTL